jgi:membrane-bound metal-dependent hydrolase YbcI (DUF457 family)
MIGPTHFFFALSLAYVLRFPLLPAAIGGIIVDLDYFLDYGFPFMHRGIIHTPVILAVSVILIYLATKRTDVSLSFGLGFLSHLFLDVINPTGILLLYPVATFYSLNLAYYDSILANLGIIAWSCLFILMLGSGYFRERLCSIFGVRMEAGTGGKHG